MLSHALLGNMKQRARRTLTLGAYRAAGGAGRSEPPTPSSRPWTQTAEPSRGILLPPRRWAKKQATPATAPSCAKLNADDPEVAGYSAS